MEDYGLSPVIQKMVLSTRDVVPNILHYVTDCKKDVEKVNVYLADVNDAMPLRRELSAVQGIVISSSLYNNLEINALGATKGVALMWLADYLGIAPEATMAFGDGENDISMLEAAGVGIAMGNGLDIAKNAADRITPVSYTHLALSLLDQCVAFHYGRVLTYDNALEVLGAVDSSVFSQMFGAIVEGRTRDCICSWLDNSEKIRIYRISVVPSALPASLLSCFKFSSDISTRPSASSALRIKSRFLIYHIKSVTNWPRCV